MARVRFALVLLMANLTALSDAIPQETALDSLPERPLRRTFARRAVDSTGFSVSFEVLVSLPARHVGFVASASQTLRRPRHVD